MFLKLHERYSEVRAAGKDDIEEQKLVEKDAEYLEEVTSKVYPLLDQLDSYLASLSIPTRGVQNTKKSCMN